MTEEELIINYRKRGIGYKNIAQLVGVSRDHVRYVLKKNNIETEWNPSNIGTKVCLQCGKEYILKAVNQKYCSNECIKQHIQDMRKPVRSSRLVPCKVCGKLFISFHGKKICSEECQKENRKYYDKKYACSKQTVSKAIKENRFCKNCGKEFITNTGKQIFCSTKCGKAYRRLGRKYHLYPTDRFKEAVTVDKTVKLYTLIKRDNNECQICKRQCDLYDYVVSPGGAMIVGERYPTVDHIIPCVLGGSHTWDNVQLACFKCNVKKRDMYDKQGQRDQEGN